MNTQESKIFNDRTYSGGYGFVAIPDKATIEKCYYLVQEKFPQDWEYLLTVGYLPHVTLYHSKMKEVPVEFAVQMKEKLNASLKRLSLNLNSLICFGGKFVFWNIETSGASYDNIMSCHTEALELANYLDRTASKRAEEEGLSLTDREKENVPMMIARAGILKEMPPKNIP
jgi:predicted AlkP superfamily pyrophosphatase or phosphodiesterase